MTAPLTQRETTAGKTFGELVSRRLGADAVAWQSAGWCPDRHGWRLQLFLTRQGGYRATVIYRLAHWTSMRRIPGLPMLLTALNVALHGIEMTPAMDVGPGLYLAHTVGTVVNADKIGANVELQGGLTIGQRRGDGFPTIEDGVMVAAGARVLGAITVGSGAVIGANAVVVTDVSPNTTMVGVPARPLQRDRDEAASA